MTDPTPNSTNPGLDPEKKVSETPAEENIPQSEHKGAEAEPQHQDGSQKKIEDLTNALARCMADLQNYRRRSEEEKGRFVKFANLELLRLLLPALENLERTCRHLPDEFKENAWAKGVLHTQADLTKALKKIGVEKMPTVGGKADPAKHEFLLQGPGEKGVILEELEAGYLLNGEVLKPAKVKVGDGTK